MGPSGRRRGAIAPRRCAPTRARRVRFPLTLRGSALEVDIEEHQVTYVLKSGDALTACHFGREFTVTVDAPAVFPGQYRTLDEAPPAGASATDTIGPSGEDGSDAST